MGTRSIVFLLAGAVIFGAACTKTPTREELQAQLREAAQAHAKHLSSDRLLAQGVEYYQAGKWSQAETNLNAFLRLNPSHPLRDEITQRLAYIEIDRKRSEQLEEMIRVGYRRVEIGELVVEPKKFAGKKIVCSGFFSGQNLDVFFLWARFGKGGNIRVDASKLPPARKKDLLGSLDGFHRVLVTGVVRVQKLKRPITAGRAIGGVKRIHSRTIVIADKVLDLGRGDPQR